MSNKKLIITIIFLGVLFALVGLLLAMNATGVFDLKEALSDMPVIGERFKIDDPVMIVAPLEDENLQLKKNIEELQAILAEKEKEINNFDKEKAEFENKIIVLQNQLKEIEQKEIQSAQLAQIYGKMEDRQAVRIFDNLDDDTVVSILVRIPSEKTASFLAGMDPMRAAKLTAVLTDKAIDAAN